MQERGLPTCNCFDNYKNMMLRSKPVLRLGAIPFVIMHIGGAKLLMGLYIVSCFILFPPLAKEDLFPRSFFPVRGRLTTLFSSISAKLFHVWCEFKQECGFLSQVYGYALATLLRLRKRPSHG